MKDCFLCKKNYPHTHYVLIPIRDAKTNEMKMLQVKEGSALHKKVLETRY
jgi:hypothetical protein